MSWFRWRTYVPAWKRQAQADREMKKLRKEGMDIRPVLLEGRTIAATFWGKAWCDHLEKFGDYENRLPRGRTYVRNGSVCHLDIRKGKIEAKVSGSSMYDVKVSIRTLPAAKWERIRKSCAGKVGSLLELLQGKLSNRVMDIVTEKKEGLFPAPKEIDYDCSCPDWADMCKHIAAVFYGVGARLDKSPELLFLLRGVDHNELVCASAAKAVVAKTSVGKGRALDKADLSRVFGIDLAEGKGREKAKRKAALAKPRRSAKAGKKRW